MEIIDSPLIAYLAWFRAQPTEIRVSIASQMIDLAPEDMLGVVKDGAADEEVVVTFMLKQVQGKPAPHTPTAGMMFLVHALTRFVVNPDSTWERRADTMGPEDWRHEALRTGRENVRADDLVDEEGRRELRWIKCRAAWATLEETEFNELQIERWLDGQRFQAMVIRDNAVLARRRTRTLDEIALAKGRVPQDLDHRRAVVD